MDFKSPMDPLELRIRAFVDDTSKLMHMPPEYKHEYEMHFREHLGLAKAENANYAEIIDETLGAYSRALNAAHAQSREELYGDLEGYAVIFSTVFLAREQALKNPVLRKAFVKIIPRH